MRNILALLALVACTSPAVETGDEVDTDTDTDTDTEASAWEVLPSLPAGGAWPAVAVLDGVIHVIPSNSTAHFALVEGAWVDRSPNPQAAHYRGAAALEGVLHLVGGGSPGAMDSIADHHVYDPDADSWSTAEPMATPRGYLVVEAVGGDLFAMSGPHVSEQELHILSEAWDPVSDSWSRKADLPDRWMLYSANAASDGGLYRLLGGISGAADARAWHYSHASDSWTQLATAPRATHGAAGAVLDGKVLAMGGYRDGLYLTEVQVYDPQSDSWSEGPELPRKIAYSSGASLDGCAFVIGGHDSVDEAGAAIAVMRLCEL